MMQFIQGQGLDAVLDELKKLRDARATKSFHTTTPEYPEKGRVAADIAQSLVTGRFAIGAGASASPAGASATEAWSSASAPLVPASATHSDASILARRVSTTERLYRWGRRNPALATAVGLVALLLVATTVGSIVAAARFRNIAEAARIAASDRDPRAARGRAPRPSAVPDGPVTVVQWRGAHRRFRRRTARRVSALAGATAETGRRDPR
ncbi:MAG: hypothetical protein ACHRXM_38390 [Isosphaerales bacterium]